MVRHNPAMDDDTYDPRGPGQDQQSYYQGSHHGGPPPQRAPPSPTGTAQNSYHGGPPPASQGPPPRGSHDRGNPRDSYPASDSGHSPYPPQSASSYGNQDYPPPRQPQGHDYPPPRQPQGHDYPPPRQPQGYDYPPSRQPQTQYNRHPRAHSEERPRSYDTGHRGYSPDNHDRGRRRSPTPDYHTGNRQGGKPQRSKSTKQQIFDGLQNILTGGGGGGARSPSRERGRYDHGGYSSHGGYPPHDRYNDYDHRYGPPPANERPKSMLEMFGKAAVPTAAAMASSLFSKQKGPYVKKNDRITDVMTSAFATLMADIGQQKSGGSQKHSISRPLTSLAWGMLTNKGAKTARSISRSRSRGAKGDRRNSIPPSSNRFDDSRNNYNNNYHQRNNSHDGAFRGRTHSADSSQEPKRGLSKSRVAKYAAAAAGVAGAKFGYDKLKQKHQQQQKSQHDNGDRSNSPPGHRRGRSESRSHDDFNRQRSNSTQLEKEYKKSRMKELLTGGLATVATIHAAHQIYATFKSSEDRRQKVREGLLSPEEARKHKTKNWIQDAAAVGIAALGIRSAYEEWKETKEAHHEYCEKRDIHKSHVQSRKQRVLGDSGDPDSPRPALTHPDHSGPRPPTYVDYEYGGGLVFPPLTSTVPLNEHSAQRPFPDTDTFPPNNRDRGRGRHTSSSPARSESRQPPRSLDTTQSQYAPSSSGRETSINPNHPRQRNTAPSVASVG